MIDSGLSSSDRTTSLTKIAALLPTSAKSPAMQRPLVIALMVTLCFLVAFQVWQTPLEYLKITDENVSSIPSTGGASIDSTTTNAIPDGIDSTGSPAKTNGIDSTTPAPAAETELTAPAPSEPPAPIYYAVVIETEAPSNLIPLTLHFSSILGPSWPIVLFTLESAWTLPESAAFRRALESRAIQVRFLPPDTRFPNSTAVSQFLTAPWFWEQLQDAERVLMFQMDSVICSKSAHTIEEFLEYDLIGAPIASKFGAGYNGGLSLRNPKLALQIVREEEEFSNGLGRDPAEGQVEQVADYAARKFEDQWFYKMVKQRNGNLPSVQVARTFGVESLWWERPFGYHQPSRWWQGRMDAINEYCPEVNMLIGRRAE